MSNEILTQDDLKKMCWERPLLIGGLADMDTESICSDLSFVDRFALDNGQRIKCVVHTLGQGVAPRAVIWAQNNNRKHAPFKVSGHGLKLSEQIPRVFEVGKPSVTLMFPGLSLAHKSALAQSRCRGIPIVHIDEFYPQLTVEDAREMGISFSRACSKGFSPKKDSWESGTLPELVKFREETRDNSFLPDDKQRQKFEWAEKALKQACLKS